MASPQGWGASQMELGGGMNNMAMGTSQSGMMGMMGGMAGGGGGVGGMVRQAAAGSAPSPLVATQPEIQRYMASFAALAVNGQVTGASAKDVFTRSGLATSELASVWDLSDHNKDGHLDSYEFCVAMHLISCRRAGMAVPGSVPQSLSSSIKGGGVPLGVAGCHQAQGGANGGMAMGGGAGGGGGFAGTVGGLTMGSGGGVNMMQGQDAFGNLTGGPLLQQQQQHGVASWPSSSSAPSNSVAGTGMASIQAIGAKGGDDEFGDFEGSKSAAVGVGSASKSDDFGDFASATFVGASTAGPSDEFGDFESASGALLGSPLPPSSASARPSFGGGLVGAFDDLLAADASPAPPAVDSPSINGAASASNGAFQISGAPNGGSQVGVGNSVGGIGAGMGAAVGGGMGGAPAGGSATSISGFEPQRGTAGNALGTMVSSAEGGGGRLDPFGEFVQGKTSSTTIPVQASDWGGGGIGAGMGIGGVVVGGGGKGVEGGGDDPFGDFVSASGQALEAAPGGGAEGVTRGVGMGGLGAGADPLAEFAQSSDAPQPSGRAAAAAATAGAVAMPVAATEAFGQFFTPSKAQGGVGAIEGLQQGEEGPPNLNHTSMNQIENDDDEFAAFESAPVGFGAPAEADAFDFPGFGDTGGKKGAGSQLLEPLDVGGTAGGVPGGGVASPGGGGAASTPGSAAKAKAEKTAAMLEESLIKQPSMKELVTKKSQDFGDFGGDWGASGGGGGGGRGLLSVFDEMVEGDGILGAGDAAKAKEGECGVDDGDDYGDFDIYESTTGAAASATASDEFGDFATMGGGAAEGGGQGVADFGAFGNAGAVRAGGQAAVGEGEDDFGAFGNAGSVEGGAGAGNDEFGEWGAFQGGSGAAVAGAGTPGYGGEAVAAALDGDFGDFGSAAPVVGQGLVPASADEEFGDFGAFEGAGDTGTAVGVSGNGEDSGWGGCVAGSGVGGGEVGSVGRSGDRVDPFAGMLHVGGGVGQVPDGGDGGGSVGVFGEGTLGEGGGGGDGQLLGGGGSLSGADAHREPIIGTLPAERGVGDQFKPNQIGDRGTVEDNVKRLEMMVSAELGHNFDSDSDVEEWGGFPAQEAVQAQETHEESQGKVEGVHEESQGKIGGVHEESQGKIEGVHEESLFGVEGAFEGLSIGGDEGGNGAAEVEGNDPYAGLLGMQETAEAGAQATAKEGAQELVKPATVGGTPDLLSASPLKTAGGTPDEKVASPPPTKIASGQVDMLSFSPGGGVSGGTPPRADLTSSPPKSVDLFSFSPGGGVDGGTPHAPPEASPPPESGGGVDLLSFSPAALAVELSEGRGGRGSGGEGGVVADRADFFEGEGIDGGGSDERGGFGVVSSSAESEGVQQPIEGVQQPIEGVQQPIEGVQQPIEGVQQPIGNGSVIGGGEDGADSSQPDLLSFSPLKVLSPGGGAPDLNLAAPPTPPGATPGPSESSSKQVLGLGGEFRVSGDAGGGGGEGAAEFAGFEAFEGGGGALEEEGPGEDGVKAAVNDDFGDFGAFEGVGGEGAGAGQGEGKEDDFGDFGSAAAAAAAGGEQVKEGQGGSESGAFGDFGAFEEGQGVQASKAGSERDETVQQPVSLFPEPGPFDGISEPGLLDGNTLLAGNFNGDEVGPGEAQVMSNGFAEQDPLEAGERRPALQFLVRLCIEELKAGTALVQLLIRGREELGDSAHVACSEVRQSSKVTNFIQGSACIYKVAKRVSWKLDGMGEGGADAAGTELNSTYAGIADLIHVSGVEEWASVWGMETVTGLGGNANGDGLRQPAAGRGCIVCGVDLAIVGPSEGVVTWRNGGQRVHSACANWCLNRCPPSVTSVLLP